MPVKNAHPPFARIYDAYLDLQGKKRQYSQAIHVFHDRTMEYNDIIDQLPVTELETHQKKFNYHERTLHEVMDSFDRTLKSYNQLLKKFQSDLQSTKSFVSDKKKITMKLVRGELHVKVSGKQK